MIDYLKIADRATIDFNWLSRADQEDMMGYILLHIVRYWSIHGEDRRMFEIIAHRRARVWWRLNKKHILSKPFAILEGDKVLEFQELDEFETIIGVLGDQDQNIIRLYYKDDLTMQQIADKFGLTYQAISRKIKRILGVLRIWTSPVT